MRRKANGTLYGERLTLRAVRMAPHHLERLKSLGGGNVSAGLRRALEIVEAQEAAALAAIKSAAERRDQTRVAEEARA